MTNQHILVLVQTRGRFATRGGHCLFAHLKCAISLIFSAGISVSGLKNRISTRYMCEQYLLGPHENLERLIVLVPRLSCRKGQGPHRVNKSGSQTHPQRAQQRKPIIGSGGRGPSRGPGGSRSPGGGQGSKAPPAAEEVFVFKQ